MHSLLMVRAPGLQPTDLAQQEQGEGRSKRGGKGGADGVKVCGWCSGSE